jgi:hypothetical protein
MDSNALISAGSGLVGVVVGAACTAFNQRRGRINERYRDQLQNLYSPMHGMREKIKAKSELRNRLSGIAGEIFPSIARTATEEKKKKYDELQDYSDKQLREELIPTYREMATLFTERMYLAEASTRRHYATLLEFVEIWNRHLAGSIPSEVSQRLEHDEKKLYPFYKDVEENFTKLQGKLSGRFGKLRS